MHPRRGPRLSSRWSSPRTARLRIRSMADVGPCCIGPVAGSAWRKGSADPRRGLRAISAMYQRVCMKMDSVAEGTCSPICIGTVAALEKGNLAFLSSPCPQSPRFAPGPHCACGLGGFVSSESAAAFFAARTSEKQTPRASNLLPYITRRHIQQRIDDCGRHVAAAFAAPRHNPGHAVEFHDELF